MICISSDSCHNYPKNPNAPENRNPPTQPQPMEIYETLFCSYFPCYPIPEGVTPPAIRRQPLGCGFQNLSPFRTPRAVKRKGRQIDQAHGTVSIGHFATFFKRSKFHFAAFNVVNPSPSAQRATFFPFLEMAFHRHNPRESR